MDWSEWTAVGEGIFAAGALVLVSGGAKAALKARNKGGRWPRAFAPWGVAAFALVFLRHWVLDQALFRAPSEALEAAKSVPELVRRLQDWNDLFFHYGILLGIPAAFLLGYLFHSFTSLVRTWFIKVPLGVVGAVALYVAHQMVSGRADGVGEALGHLREWVGTWVG